MGSASSRRIAAMALIGLAAGLAPSALGGEKEKVVFNRDVRPILSDNCFVCHGPDKNQRKADLRLDLRDAAVKHEAIVPGKPDESELVARILSDDPDEMMPPAEVEQDAHARAEGDSSSAGSPRGPIIQQHWAYEKPVKPPIPAGPERDRCPGRAPAGRARAEALARGRPPHPDPPALISTCSACRRRPRRSRRSSRTRRPTPTRSWSTGCSPRPHYGERMAIGWLDVVRFADTIGYHSDNPRNVWPYRDWVIQASTRTSPSTASPSSSSPATCCPTRPRSSGRLGVQPAPAHAPRKGGAGQGLRGPDADRPRPRRRHGLAGPDHRLLPVPRPQVRPVHRSKDFYSLGAFFADIQEPIIGHREDGMVVGSAEDSRPPS